MYVQVNDIHELVIRSVREKSVQIVVLVDTTSNVTSDVRMLALLADQ